MTFAIVEAPAESAVGFAAYGAARDLWRYKGPEVILEGPYQTGKTIACLQKLNALLAKYPRSRALMVRRTYASLVHSAVVTYEQKVLPYPPDHPKCAVVKLGKSKPELYTYPNGSTITLGGLDNPDKFLSAEFDYIYINQAEELLLDHYEKLAGRATGRAGNSPYPQVIADCNPDVPTHWILQRDRLKRFKSLHQHNPTLYDQVTGEITELGRLTMDGLNALTGVRLKRGRDGLWVGVEGMVYEEWSNDVHLVDRFEIPKSWRRIRVIDFGLVNPFVCQWWAIDGDLRMYRYRELYMTQRTVSTHARLIKALSAGETYEATIADHDAEDRATLKEHGIETIAADKRVKVGIEKVQERLILQKDGKPRLFLLRDSLVEEDAALAGKFKPTKTEDEFPAYAWTPTKDGRPAKEEPVKLDDHGMDTLRYAVMYLDGQTRYAPPGAVKYA